MNHKSHMLKLFISEHQPSVITLNETVIIPSDLTIHGYHISQPDPNPNQGVAILYSKNIRATPLPQIDLDNPTKNLHHAILINTPTHQIQVATIYCPRGNPSLELITKIIQRHPHTIITGDFNVRHEDFGHPKNNRGGRNLVNIMNHHHLTKLNDNAPTYINDTTGKEDVKDLIFSSTELTKQFEEFWVDEDLGSDHKTIFATFTLPHFPPPTLTKNILLHHLADWQTINQNITQTMKNHILNHNSTTEDIDQYIKTLSSVIKHNIKTSIKSIIN